MDQNAVHQNIDMEMGKFLSKSEDDKKIEFNGLSKEEVMKSANDPKWVRLRWTMFILFWIVWVAMLVAAALIIYFTPKCGFIPKQPWWEKEFAYEVDVKYFKDSDNDGVGDFKGLESKLSYLKDEIGVRTVVLGSGILKEDGNGIEIDSKFESGGFTLDNLRKSFKSNDMHLIVDIPYRSVENDKELKVVNHWLDLTDGVRINGVTNTSDFKLLDQYSSAIQAKESESFSRKFFALYPGSSEQVKELNTYFFDLTIKNDFQFDIIENSYKNFNPDKWPSFKIDFSNSEIPKRYLKLAHGVALLMRGTPFILYGDEIYLTTQGDKRLMKWDSSLNCGFSTKNLGLNTSCVETVKEEVSHGAGNTLIRLYKNLAKLRLENSFLFGEIIFPKNHIKDMGMFVSKASSFDGYIVAGNFGESRQFFNFKSAFPQLNLPSEAQVAFFDWYDSRKNFDLDVGKEVSTEGVLLQPGEFLVLSYSEGNSPQEKKSSNQHH